MSRSTVLIINENSQFSGITLCYKYAIKIRKVIIEVRKLSGLQGYLILAYVMFGSVDYVLMRQADQM